MDDILVLPIGSVINNSIPEEPRKIVVGSGFGYGQALRRENLSSYRVLFTRGPITNMILDLPPAHEAIDLAYALVLMGYVQAEERNRVLVIPHHSNPCVRLLFSESNQAYYPLGDYWIMNPFANLHVVIKLISEARYVISEAMHGAIIADSLRVPWVSASFGGKVYELKWHDWLLSFGEKYSPIVLAPMLAERSVLYRALNKFHLNRRLMLAELHDGIEKARLESLLQLTDDAVLDRKLCFLDESIGKLRSYLCESRKTSA